MAFRDLPEQEQAVKLLQRSLAAGRVGHAYLFVGDRLAPLVGVARSFAQALLCDRPVQDVSHGLWDGCNECSACRRVEHGNHPDVHWVRPESRLRLITIDQVRDLSREVFLKPHEGRWKVGVLVEADCLNAQAANALLKTLEEPPSRSVLVLLTTQPGRLLDTIVSRCLRVRFAAGAEPLPPERLAWLREWTALAAGAGSGLLDRYRMVDLLLQQLEAAREEAKREVARQEELAASGSSTEPVAGAAEEEGWEAEAAPAGAGQARSAGEEKAALEAEYRRRRDELLTTLLQWFRDVWCVCLGMEEVRRFYPGLDTTQQLARKLDAAEALQNLRTWEDLLFTLRRTNVQELLALESAVLRLRLGEARAVAARASG